MVNNLMDKPLKVKRNGLGARLSRNLFTVAAIFAVVFSVGALPVVFVYFMNLTYAYPAQSEGKTFAFVNVSVVPMDGERIIENQTVIVKDGLIKKIGSSWLTSIPSEALRIDGKGKYLIPGLSDMHVHLHYYEDETIEAMFRLF